MKNFEYSAYDTNNNFALVVMLFETLEEAQKYKRENVGDHKNQSIRYVMPPPPNAQPPSGGNVGL